MDLLGAALSSLASLLFLTLVVAAVIKAFQIASTLTEVKDLLADIKRNTNAHSLGGPLTSSPMSVESADNLLRAVAEMDHPVPPAPIELEPKN